MHASPYAERHGPRYRNASRRGSIGLFPPTAAVFIDKGRDLSARRSPELAPRTRPMVNPGDVASIPNADTCAVKVGSGRLWTIQAAAPCAKGTHQIDLTGRRTDRGPRFGLPGVDPVIVGSVAVSVGPVIGRLASWCGARTRARAPKFPPELRPYKPGQ
jgi:hypothetical protein